MYKRDKVGHILSLTVGNETISGEEFRKLLELPSSNFTMQAADGKIRFLCKGQGHGLGLSQYGGKKKIPDRIEKRCILLKNQGIL